MKNLLKLVNMRSRSTIRASAGASKLRMLMICSIKWTRNLKVYQMIESQRSSLEKNSTRSRRKKLSWRNRESLTILFALKKLTSRSRKDNLYASLVKLDLERVLFSMQWSVTYCPFQVTSFNLTRDLTAGKKNWIKKKLSHSSQT